MSAAAVQKKAPAAGNARNDSKKIKTLCETFPFLSEEEAAILLQEYDGSLKLASEAALQGERWQKITKAKKAKKEDKPVETSPVERKPRKELKDSKDRKPRVDKYDKNEKAVEEVKVTGPTVTQKLEVQASNWVKGKSISFIDMLKKSKETADEKTKENSAPAAAAPAAAATPSPKVADKKEKVAKEESKSTESKTTEAKPVESVDVAAPAAAADATKVRRERKPRSEAPSKSESTPVAEVPFVAAAAPAVVAPAVVAPVAKPVVKYVLEFDRVNSAVALPKHVEDLAQRFSSTWTFSGTQGRAPTPPAPTPAPAAAQPNFAVSLNAPRQAWPGAADPIQAQQQRVAQQQNTHWGGESHGAAAAGWGRPQMNFTTYQPTYQQQQAQAYRAGPMNYAGQGRYGNHHSHHHSHQRMHPDHVASDVAYSAIREEPQRFSGGGVW